MRVVVIIPARGGSKGLPKKNCKPLLGKPLIGWTIETALQLIPAINATVIVSSDDDEIISISKTFGAEVPFVRPHFLAEDTSTSSDVILHALNYFEKKDVHFDYVIMLEATSPLRDATDVLNALSQLLSTTQAKSIVGVSKVESASPVFQVALNESKFIKPFVNTNFKFFRRQEIQELYFFEGSLYISSVEYFKKIKSFYSEYTIGYIMPKWKSFEIDDLEDFIIVESIMEKKLKGAFS